MIATIVIKSYLIHDGYVDFLGQVDDFSAGEISQNDMRELTKEIDSLGYSAALFSYTSL